ncbi:hypothetical protein H696_02185 [Fonticula alba]|uniref:Uncharacterized protein n=1 Tax=Fonticula alba TaxID=691883 RepID=A0A058ZAC2_FONAL|nr:hypothetical protein H696_02185 [Fonticula alba]KCV71235.1 hypothetical protein H696_02185 [Fonticula alba]|eukprot:XP_009494358.1 hypothetical protein H696_02185 [Fonticula alba]
MRRPLEPDQPRAEEGAAADGHLPGRPEDPSPAGVALPAARIADLADHPEHIDAALDLPAALLRRPVAFAGEFARLCAALVQSPGDHFSRADIQRLEEVVFPQLSTLAGGAKPIDALVDRALRRPLLVRLAWSLRRQALALARRLGDVEGEAGALPALAALGALEPTESEHAEELEEPEESACPRDDTPPGPGACLRECLSICTFVLLCSQGPEEDAAMAPHVALALALAADTCQALAAADALASRRGDATQAGAPLGPVGGLMRDLRAFGSALELRLGFVFDLVRRAAWRRELALGGSPDDLAPAVRQAAQRLGLWAVRLAQSPWREGLRSAAASMGLALALPPGPASVATVATIPPGELLSSALQGAMLFSLGASHPGAGDRHRAPTLPAGVPTSQGEGLSPGSGPAVSLVTFLLVHLAQLAFAGPLTPELLAPGAGPCLLCGRAGGHAGDPRARARPSGPKARPGRRACPEATGRMLAECLAAAALRHALSAGAGSDPGDHLPLLRRALLEMGPWRAEAAAVMPGSCLPGVIGELLVLRREPGYPAAGPLAGHLARRVWATPDMVLATLRVDVALAVLQAASSPEADSPPTPGRTLELARDLATRATTAAFDARSLLALAAGRFQLSLAVGMLHRALPAGRRPAVCASCPQAPGPNASAVVLPPPSSSQSQSDNALDDSSPLCWAWLLCLSRPLACDVSPFVVVLDPAPAPGLSPSQGDPLLADLRLQAALCLAQLAAGEAGAPSRPRVLATQALAVGLARHPELARQRAIQAAIFAALADESSGVRRAAAALCHPAAGPAGRTFTAAAQALLAERIQDVSPPVRRAATEAVADFLAHPTSDVSFARLVALLLRRMLDPSTPVVNAACDALERFLLPSAPFMRTGPARAELCAGIVALAAETLDLQPGEASLHGAFSQFLMMALGRAHAGLSAVLHGPAVPCVRCTGHATVEGAHLNPWAAARRDTCRECAPPAATARRLPDPLTDDVAGEEAQEDGDEDDDSRLAALGAGETDDMDDPAARQSRHLARCSELLAEASFEALWRQLPADPASMKSEPGQHPAGPPLAGVAHFLGAWLRTHPGLLHQRLPMLATLLARLRAPAGPTHAGHALAVLADSIRLASPGLALRQPPGFEQTLLALQVAAVTGPPDVVASAVPAVLSLARGRRSSQAVGHLLAYCEANLFPDPGQPPVAAGTTPKQRPLRLSAAAGPLSAPRPAGAAAPPVPAGVFTPEHLPRACRGILILALLARPADAPDGALPGDSVLARHFAGSPAGMLVHVIYAAAEMVQTEALAAGPRGTLWDTLLRASALAGERLPRFLNHPALQGLFGRALSGAAPAGVQLTALRATRDLLEHDLRAVEAAAAAAATAAASPAGPRRPTNEDLLANYGAKPGFFLSWAVAHLATPALQGCLLAEPLRPMSFWIVDHLAARQLLPTTELLPVLVALLTDHRPDIAARALELLSLPALASAAPSSVRVALPLIWRLQRSIQGASFPIGCVGSRRSRSARLQPVDSVLDPLLGHLFRTRAQRVLLLASISKLIGAGDFRASDHLSLTLMLLEAWIATDGLMYGELLALADSLPGGLNAPPTPVADAASPAGLCPELLALDAGYLAHDLVDEEHARLLLGKLAQLRASCARSTGGF